MEYNGIFSNANNGDYSEARASGTYPANHSAGANTSGEVDWLVDIRDPAMLYDAGFRAIEHTDGLQHVRRDSIFELTISPCADATGREPLRGCIRYVTGQCVPTYFDVTKTLARIILTLDNRRLMHMLADLPLPDLCGGD